MDEHTLSELNIRSFLHRQDIGITVYPVTDSTNTQARMMLAEGRRPPFLVIAGEQTAGRGRRGNSFFSPSSGLYYTLVTAPEDEEAALARTTIAAAVSVYEAVQKTAGISCDIKWVNDLYLDNKKVCGILCEAPRDTHNRLSGIIIGIGINIARESFPEELKDKAGSLGRPDLDRSRLAAVLTDILLDHTADLYDPAILETYKKHSFLLGKEVSFMTGGVPHRGIACDINEDGNLVVKGEKTWVLSSGEVSLTAWE